MSGAAGAGANDEYMQRLKMYQTVQPIGETPFGESVNLYTGELGFNQTDIELEGNGPALVLTRQYQSSRQQADTVNTMDDWKLSIPRMETMSKGGWQVSTFPNNPGSPVASYARCTQFNKPYDPHNEQYLWWHGYELITERNDRQQVLFRNAATATPTGIDAGNGVLTHFPAMTQQNWVIGCLPQTSNGASGEGFLAVSPDGTKYHFTHLVSAPATTVYEYDPDLKLPIKHYRSLQVMYVTRIEDRFGNYLTYAYDGTRLTSITASDGRKVSLLWNNGSGASDQTVAQIIVQPGSAAPRNWYYTYENSQLRYVTRPDGSQWSFALHAANILALPTNTCATRAPGDATGPQTVSTVGHPSGLVGSFVMAGKFHARSYVPSYCDPIPPSLEVQENNFPIFSTSSLISKTLSGPGIANGTWTYSYSAPVGSTTHDPCAQNDTCQDWRTVEVKDPGGDRIRYTLSTHWGPLESKLLKTEHFEGAAAAALRTDTIDYAPANNGPYPANLGGTGQVWQTNSEKSTTWTPERTRTIAQQGVVFTWKANSFDAFARPLNVVRSSTLGYSRTDVTAYHHNTVKWVVGQVASSTNSNTGLVESQTIYDPTYALPIQTKAFGKLQQTLAYDMASAAATGQRGTLLTMKDGNNNVTTLTQWKRGIPGKIAFADGEFRTAVIDDLGQIQTVTDENGFITNYDYDAMGRLSLIDYPNGDTVNWANTTITFAKNNAAVYGLPAGHWYQAVTTGNARKVTYFDALWRPVVVAEYDNADIAGTLRQSVTRYDAEGRPTFASYPQRETNAAVYNTWANPAVAPTLAGTDTVYDALGRVLTTKADSELPGQLTTTYEYLSSFQTKVTNPRGFATTYRYYAYDQPSTDQLRMVIHPEGAITEFYRDAFGKPLNLIRHNSDSSVSVNRTYTYTSNTQELCRTVEPETGATDYGYDAAGNLKWSAAGLPSNIGCDLEGDHSVIAPRRVDRTYDARNRLKTLVFPDGLGNQTWTYTPDGLTQSIVTDNGGGKVATNTYAYNQRRLMTDEDLSVAGVFNWPIDYGYDVHGHLTVQNWHGVSVGFSPNALGQPTRAGTYATGVKYYPNGAMKEFTYGNGILHLLTQNARGLPDRSLDIYQSFHYLDDGYDYDQNGNVAAISDGRDGNHRGNRTLTYDGLDRLKTAVSPMYGNAAYAYDVLDNLTRVTVGGTAARDHYYCYDTANRLTNVKTGSCAGTSVIGLGYDVQGNLANKNGTAYTFDFGNRLRGTGAPGNVTYAYDGHGRRVMDQTPAGVKYSHYNQAGQLTMTGDDRADKVIEYIHLNGSLVATRERDTLTNVYSTRYHHTDALGSPVAVTDANKAVIEKSEYEPFGFVNNRPAKDGPGFTGHVLDAATGLNYMQQRYYDPVIGRFLSRDPVTADAQTGANFNAYWYANNNPYRFTDPDGRAPCEWCDRGLFPKGDIVRTTGEAMGALAAYGVGVATDNQALQDVAIEGMRENVKPQDGLNAAMMGVGPRGGRGAVGEGAVAGMKSGSSGGPGSGKAFSPGIKDAAEGQAGGNCVFCGTKTTREPGPNQRNTDHADPKSRGGNNTLENAQNTCRTCNQDKKTMTTQEYLEKRRGQ